MRINYCSLPFVRHRAYFKGFQVVGHIGGEKI